MAEAAAAPSRNSASFMLGQKLDSIPFSLYHIAIILVLGLVGFTDGYDLALTGSLLVLAKAPLHITPEQIRWLTIGGFFFSALSDHISRKTVVLIGVIATTFFTLLIPLVQSSEQLIAVRLLTGLGAGGVVSAAFPIAAELMPAQHRRTYGAIYEICLASAFALLPLVAGFLAGSENGFRWIALPGGLAIFVVPILVHLVIPQSARWQLRKGQTQAAVDTVNEYIRRCGSRVPPLTVAELGTNLTETRAQLPKFTALFAPGQMRWTTVGILTSISAGTAYYLTAILMPKALIEQGAAVTTGFAITTIIFLSTIPGKAFNALLMERWGRRWAIAYALSGAFPGLALMAFAHQAGEMAGIVMTIGAIVLGFTALSSFTVVRVYLSEQFPTALRGRGNVFGEAFGRIFAGVLAPFLIEPHVGEPFAFFGTITAVLLCGAFIPVLFGRETVGSLDHVTEAELAPALGD